MEKVHKVSISKDYKKLFDQILPPVIKYIF